MEDERLEAVLPHCRGRLLDVGCGPGNELVRRYDGPGIGVDVAPWPGIDLLCDTRRMPFEDGSFDTITIVAAFNHIPDRAAVLRECRRLLASHGRLIITMIGPVVGYIRHRLIAGWDPDQLHRQHQPGELPGMSNRHIRRLLEEARFEIELHRRFVLGLNNLFVARPNRQQPADSNGAVGVVASQTVTLTAVARKRGCNNRSGGDQAPSAEDTTTMR